MQDSQFKRLQDLLQCQDALEFSVLIGSQSTGEASEMSDWDIALQWKLKESDYLKYLAQIEYLRKDIANLLDVPSQRIDLINIPSAKLAMREVIANQGTILSGKDSLAWIHFLNRTWRDLEDYYWDDIYVA